MVVRHSMNILFFGLFVDIPCKRTNTVSCLRINIRLELPEHWGYTFPTELWGTL